MADLGHQMTDEKLEQLERKVHKTYKEAYKEMQDKVDAYFDRLKDRDEEQKALLEAGKITEQQYQQWRLTQYARGKRYRALRDEFARRMNEANKVAAAYINDQTPGIYSLNANYTAYTIEQSGTSADFNLIQEQAVKRLIEEEPELFHRPAIDTPLDTVWNQRKLTDSLTAGILMGESTRQIADRFQKVTDMNRTSALRNARTAVTGAQNAGRQATYDRARAMGIEVDERWRSARDFRVRDSHRLMDGKPKDKDGYFHTPLGSIMRYPGDMQNGKAADVYNCRCTTSTKDALEAEPTMMRARDPVTGRNELVQDMTYQEWYEWKTNNSKDRFEEFKLFPAEKKLVYQGYEEGLLLDWDGSVIMNLVGTRSSIQVPNNFAEKAKGKTFSHTHPDGRTLSPADVLMMNKYHLSEVRAITDKGTYRAINTGAWKQHFDSVKELNAFYLTLDLNLIQEYQTKVYKGLISEKQADDEVQEKLMLLLSKEVGFMYEFIPK